MVATYDRDGVRFLYPENWELREESQQWPVQCVTLESPGSGFWMLQVFPGEESCERLADEILRTIREDYEDVECVPVSEQIQQTPTAGYNLQFYCLDFVVEAHIRGFRLGHRTCALLCQAEDREFEQLLDVFLAMTTSLLSESGRVADPA